jgi:hypothetical protein
VCVLRWPCPPWLVGLALESPSTAPTVQRYVFVSLAQTNSVRPRSCLASDLSGYGYSDPEFGSFITSLSLCWHFIKPFSGRGHPKNKQQSRNRIEWWRVRPKRHHGWSRHGDSDQQWGERVHRLSRARDAVEGKVNVEVAACVEDQQARHCT